MADPSRASREEAEDKRITGKMLDDYNRSGDGVATGTVRHWSERWAGGRSVLAEATMQRSACCFDSRFHDRDTVIVESWDKDVPVFTQIDRVEGEYPQGISRDWLMSSDYAP